MEIKRKHPIHGYREANLTISPGRFVYDFGAEFQGVGGEEYIDYEYKNLANDIIDGITKVTKIDSREKRKLLIYTLAFY